MGAASDAAKLFGFQPTSETELTGAGTLNWNFRVATPGRQLFVRKHRPDRSREHIEWEHRFVAYAIKRGIPAPLPLRTAEDASVVEHDGALWAAFPLAGGEPPVRGEMNERQIWAMGEMHGRIHAELANYPESVEMTPFRDMEVNRSVTNLERLISVAKSRGAEGWIVEGMTCQLELLSKYGAPASEVGLTRCPSHGDYHDQQLLFAGDHVTAVTDWEMFGMRPRAWELVRSLAFSQILEGPYLAAYITGYREHQDLPEHECRLAMELWWQSRLHTAWAFHAYLVEGNARVASLFPEMIRSLRVLAVEDYRRQLTETMVLAAR